MAKDSFFTNSNDRLFVMITTRGFLDSVACRIELVSIKVYNSANFNDDLPVHKQL